MGDSKLLWWQRQRLQKQLRQTRDARVYRRTLALLEYDRGRSVSQIARLLGVARLSVYRWIDAFEQASDPQALWEGPRPGRPHQLGEDSAQWVSSLFTCSPQDWGYPDANWTVPLLADALSQQLGRHYAAGPIRRAVHDLGYVWKRSRYVLAPDPEREKKTPDSATTGPFAAS